MKYRQIKTSFWEDGYILDLTPDEKLLFIYLFTNNKVNLCGIYELADRTIHYTLGLTLAEITKHKTKFEKDGKFIFHKNWVFIVSYCEHNIYSSAQPVVHSFATEFNLIPTAIKQYFFEKSPAPYIFPIKNFDEVLTYDNVKVKVMVKDKYGRATLGKEDIDPDTIPANLGKQI